MKFADARVTSNQFNVRIPAEAIRSPEDFGKIAAEAFARGGCPNCYSGLDFRFSQIREFVVNPRTLELEVDAIGGAGF